MGRGIWSIFKKELIQLVRDPYLVMFIITLPVLQLMITGMAIQKDVGHFKTVVANFDHRPASDDLLDSLENSRFFDIKAQVASEQDLSRMVQSGKYQVGLIIPEDYSSKILNRQEQPAVDVIIDGTNANTAKVALNAINQVVLQHSLKNVRLALLDHLPDSAGNTRVNTKILFNSELRTAYFLIPGILGIILHMLTILFTSFAIVREREHGTLEQLMVTPLRVPDLMIGKVVPYAVIGFLDMVLVLTVMIWFFNIPVSGSVWFLCFSSIVFLITSLAVGIFISTVCQTQVQAIQLTVAIFLPSLLLTGFVFPLDPMPWIIKVISYMLPLTYYLEIIRGIIIRGVGFPELWFPTLILCIFSAVGLGLSILRFKKQIA